MVWFGFTDANINNMAEAKFVGWENCFGEYGLFANPNHTDGFWQSDWGTSHHQHAEVCGGVGHPGNPCRAGGGHAAEPGVQGAHAGACRRLLVPWAIPTIVGQDVGLDAA